MGGCRPGIDGVDPLLRAALRLGKPGCRGWDRRLGRWGVGDAVWEVVELLHSVWVGVSGLVAQCERHCGGGRHRSIWSPVPFGLG